MILSPINILEASTIISTLLYNYFLIKQKKICWLFGFLSSVFGAIIFNHKEVNGQVVLHVFYAVMAIYGWYVWQKNNTTKPLQTWNSTQQTISLLVGVLAVLALHQFLLPVWQIKATLFDVAITVFCFIATYKEAQKIVTAWIYWIVLNFASAILCWESELFLYAALMLVYTAISVNGYLIWKKELKKQHL
ncbi:MAG: nicotinamide riboside transporter PnuC [Bacteroidota bacterium]